MNLETRRIQCPYCGEVISVTVDTSRGSDSYWEDCQVCSRPMAFSLSADPNGEILELAVRHEDD